MQLENNNSEFSSLAEIVFMLLSSHIIQNLEIIDIYQLKACSKKIYDSLNQIPVKYDVENPDTGIKGSILLTHLQVRKSLQDHQKIKQEIKEIQENFFYKNFLNTAQQTHMHVCNMIVFAGIAALAFSMTNTPSAILSFGSIVTGMAGASSSLFCVNRWKKHRDKQHLNLIELQKNLKQSPMPVFMKR